MGEQAAANVRALRALAARDVVPGIVEVMKAGCMELQGKIVQLGSSESAQTDGRLWEPAVVLASHLSSMPCNWKDVAVTELGCGLGLVGMVLASLGAEVTLTDLPQAQPAVSAGLQLNSTVLQGRARFAAFDWAEPQQFPTARLVVSADPIFDDATLDLFTKAAAHILERTEAKELILCHKHRPNVCTLDGVCAVKTALVDLGLVVGDMRVLGGIAHPYIPVMSVTASGRFS
mmetsp:Transcript_111749/g.256182  ORF Transcript_111749/g.256182 Transcript_111749/m.256182 type:complete len:232 (+) Transcript_111749:8-703(+)